MSRTQAIFRTGRVAALVAAAAIAGYAWVALTPPIPAEVPGGGLAVERHEVSGGTEQHTAAVAVTSGGTRPGTTDAAPVVVARLHLPPGSCQLQPDAEGNVVGTCALPQAAQPGTRVSPFGGGSWTKP